MCGVDMGMMPAMTLQAAPSDAEGPLAWGQGPLYGHTVPHTLLHLTYVLPKLQQMGKRMLSRCSDAYRFQSCRWSSVKLLCPALFEMLQRSST